MTLLESWKARWPTFSPREVLSESGLAALARNHLVIQTHALDTLQRFRSEIGIPLLINHGALKRRGYRSAEENREIGGSRFSYHIQGVAFDVTPVGMKLDDFYKAAWNFGWHALGLYPRQNFVHMDMRPRLDERQVLWTSA